MSEHEKTIDTIPVETPVITPVETSVVTPVETKSEVEEKQMITIGTVLSGFTGLFKFTKFALCAADPKTMETVVEPVADAVTDTVEKVTDVVEKVADAVTDAVEKVADAVDLVIEEITDVV